MKVSLVFKNIKQNYKAIALIAIAFFSFRIWSFIHSFEPEMFKSSILSITKVLFSGAWKDLIYANFIILPLLVVNILITLLFGPGINNLFQFISRLYVTASLTLVFAALFLNQLLSQKRISIGELKDFFHTPVYDYKIFLPLLFVFLLSLFFSFKIYKKAYRKRYYAKSFLKIPFMLILLSFNIFLSYDLLKPSLGLKYELKNRLISNFYEFKEFKKIDIHKEFENFLGLNTRYESEENLLNLLKRRTDKKKSELSVLFIYLKDFSKAEFKDIFVSDKNNFYFNKTLINTQDTEKSIQSIKANIPYIKDLDQKFSKVKVKELESYFFKPFKGYKFIETDKKEVIFKNIIKLDLERSFMLSTLTSLDKESASMIKKLVGSLEKTVVVITGKNTDQLMSNSKSLSFIRNSTYLWFSVPKDIKVTYYNPSKVVGQEDIMTTIYNLVLSEKEYLSLGDNIFIKSNSNAINENLYADQLGAFIEGEFYPWKSNKSESVEDKKFLQERYNATKEISRYILKR